VRFETTAIGRARLPAVDFLLECIGFPPDYPTDDLVRKVLEEGEPAAWRGDPARHKRLVLGGGLELRLDRENGQKSWNLLPHYAVSHRLRVAIDEIRTLPDSPFDALLLGWAAPPFDADGERESDGESEGDGSARLRGAYRLCAYVTDARRLPKKLPAGHVLALSVAGFALDVTYIGPDEGARDVQILDEECGASIRPLGSPGDPGGCAEVSLRIKSIRHLVNPITGMPVEALEVDAPERPLELFASRWQMEKDGLPPPRPGWRIEGTFMISGRIAGGLPRPKREARERFG
jgi:hypothetical protein